MSASSLLAEIPDSQLLAAFAAILSGWEQTDLVELVAELAEDPHVAATLVAILARDQV